MNEEYQKGIQIGEIISKLESLEELLKTHTEKQDKWNQVIELRLQIAEEWIQTTTGKVVVLTTIFGIVGSICYIGINWLLSHYWR